MAGGADAPHLAELAKPTFDFAPDRFLFRDFDCRTGKDFAAFQFGKWLAFKMFFIRLDSGSFCNGSGHFFERVEFGQCFRPGKPVGVKPIRGLKIFDGLFSAGSEDAVGASAEGSLQLFHRVAARPATEEDQFWKAHCGKRVRARDSVDGKTVGGLKITDSFFRARAEITIGGDSEFFLKTFDGCALEAAFEN